MHDSLSFSVLRVIFNDEYWDDSDKLYSIPSSTILNGGIGETRTLTHSTANSSELSLHHLIYSLTLIPSNCFSLDTFTLHYIGNSRITFTAGSKTQAELWQQLGPSA